MTRSHRTARACRFTAAGLAACGACSATYHPICLIPGLVGAAVFLCLAAAYQNEDRRIRLRHEQLRRAVIADDLALRQPPPPCCRFWRNTDGALHGPDCTRPSAARRDDYRLDAAGRTAFEEIAAHFDDRSAA